MTAKIEYIAIGKRDEMIAEYGAFDPREAGVDAVDCEWLLMPVGDAQFDTEYFSNEKDMNETAKYYVRQIGCKIRKV